MAAIPDGSKTVVFVTGYFPPFMGGIEAHSRELALELRRRGLRVEVLCFALDNKGPIEAGQALESEVLVTRIRPGLGRWPRMGRAIRTRHPSLFHVQGYYRPLLALMNAFASAPWVITPHGLSNAGRDDSGKKLIVLCKRLFDLIFMRRLLSKTEGIVALGPGEASFVQNRLGRRLAARTFSLGVPLPRESFQPREARGRRDSPPFVLSMGRLTERKRFHDGIEAVLGTEAFHYKVVGPDADAAKSLRHLAETAPDRISLCEPVSAAEKFHLLRSCTALLVPSEYEGIPAIALEALASGTPVIASDAAAENLPACGVVRYPVGDINSLTGALTSLLNRRTYDQLCDEAFQAAQGLEHFELYSESLLTLYAKVLEGASHS